jgi:hypothetical protein
MGKGGYTGGSTVFGRGSDWFSYRKPKGRPKHLEKLGADPRPMSEKIAEAADRLAAAKAEYDSGKWTPKQEPGRHKRRKPKPPGSKAT